MQGEECLMSTVLFTSAVLNSLYIYICFQKNSKSGVTHYTGCLESRFTKNKNHLETSELV